MIKWYQDATIGIFFNIEPKVCMRYVSPCARKEDKKKIYSKPFLNEKQLEVALIDSSIVDDFKEYNFVIPKGYCWDGATIPRIFWRLVGAKTDNRFLVPSLIHDVLCENHHYVNHDRYFADCVFERLLYVSGVNPFSRWLMFHSVDNFQKFCKWGR